jgi:hypothetical protein
METAKAHRPVDTCDCVSRDQFTGCVNAAFKVCLIRKLVDHDQQVDRERSALSLLWDAIYGRVVELAHCKSRAHVVSVRQSCSRPTVAILSRDLRWYHYTSWRNIQHRPPSQAAIAFLRCFAELSSC